MPTMARQEPESQTMNFYSVCEAGLSCPRDHFRRPHAGWNIYGVDPSQHPEFKPVTLVGVAGLVVIFCFLLVTFSFCEAPPSHPT